MVELLTALQNPDNAVRQKAETMYQQAKQGNPSELMVNMIAVLGRADAAENVKRHDCVLLRQLMAKGTEKDFVYAKVPLQGQQQIAAQLLTLFENEANPKLQKKIGDVIAKLVEYVCDKDDPRGSLQPGTNGWPALLPVVFRLANTATAKSVESCESALTLIKDCVSTLKNDITNAQAELGAIMQNGLGSPAVKHKVAVFFLICEIVTETEKKTYAPLLSTVGALVGVLTQLAQTKDEENLSSCIQCFIDVATIEPDFFKAQLQANLEPATFMATVARSKEVTDTGLRSQALEWLVSYLEKKTKWITKTIPKFTGLTLEACMSVMLEVEDSEQDLKEWLERMDDEEGEEDADELFHSGEECIDRVAEAVQMEDLGTSLFQLIGHFSSQEAWQAKHAALAAVKQTVEYVEEQSHVDQMAQLLMASMEHPHPRVRFTALHGLGQLANDQSPHFQENSHSTVIPVLARKMDDPADRVAAMAMSAFVSYGEELDNSLMAGYANELMMKLVSKLQQSKHRGVREEAITCIAVIAGVIEKDFSAYYDQIMPMLKQFVMTATGEKENRLRGKAFECMSLLGIAVGKEKFLPDAREAITAMMSTQVEADDVQREYIKEASERICTCLKKDFAPFLPPLLQGIFKNLSLENLGQQAGAQGGDDDEDAYVQVTTGDGKVVNVHTQKFEDMMQAVQLLHTFCTEMESGYFDAIQDTAKVLLPILSAQDDMNMLCDEVRGMALQVWALMIKSARLGAQERGLPNNLAKELLSSGLQVAFQQLKGEDTEQLQEVAAGIASCIKNVGEGVLGGAEINDLVGKVFGFLDESLKRTEKILMDAATSKQQAAALPQELADDEDEEQDPAEAEDQLRRNYEDILGGMMKVSPNEFLPALQACTERIKQWLSHKSTKVVGLYLACDMIEHLKELSEPAWPAFMPTLFEGVLDSDPDVRTAAAYAINLAAPLAKFAEAAPDAFRRIAQHVGGAKAKKRDDKAKVAMDNAVAALLSLAKEKGQLCPPEINAWDMVLSKLPLKDDEEEAKKVHEKIVDLVMAQNQGLLGANNANLGKVLSILAEIYKQENIISKENDVKILNVFKMLPQNILQGAAASFTQKQQKKIEKMLTSS